MILDGYIRVSQVNGREGDSFISPQVQRDQIERYAARHGHQLGLMFEELDQSGGRADRPLWQQAIARQESGEAQVLCVAKLDRFGRSVLDGLRAIERVTNAGGRFVAAVDDVDFSTSTGRMFLRMLLSQAEWELDRVRDTWDEAQRRAIARGVFTGSSVPLGYRRRESGRLVIDPRTAPLAREVFSRAAAGARPGELAVYLSAHVPTPTGKTVWSHTTVRSMIRRRVYLGEASARDYVNASAHEPLIDAATWQAAQFRRLSGPGPRRIEPAMLSGLLRCTGCGRVMMTRLDEHHRLHYVCSRRSPVGDCSKPVHIFASKVEPYVEAVMWSELKGDSERRHRAALARATHRAESATAQLEAYRDNPALPRTLGSTRFAAGLATRVEREERALLAVAEARSRSMALGPSVQTVRDSWASMSPVQRNEIIATQLDCAFVSRGKGEAAERVWAVPAGAEPNGLPPRHAKALPAPSPVSLQDTPRAEPATGTLDWSKAKTTRALTAFLSDRTEWPLFSDFQAAGLGLAHANAMRHQRIVSWSKRFDLTPPVSHRPLPGWTEQRVRDELAIATADHTQWPTHRQFVASGHGELRKAVHYFGGAHRWAAEFGLPLAYHQRTNRSKWTEESMRQAVAELASGQSAWPSRKQFDAANLGGLYASIAKAGTRRQLAESLGLALPAGERYRTATRWTEEAITDALDRFLAHRDWYPTAEDFRTAGYAGLCQKLGRRPGGHDAIAASYGLPRRSGVSARRSGSG